MAALSQLRRYQNNPYGIVPLKPNGGLPGMILPADFDQAQQDTAMSPPQAPDLNLIPKPDDIGVVGPQGEVDTMEPPKPNPKAPLPGSAAFARPAQALPQTAPPSMLSVPEKSGDFNYTPYSGPFGGPPPPPDGASAIDQRRALGPPPPMPKPNWAQRLAAAAVGAGAGYVNARGKSYIDPKQVAQAEQGILMPSYARDQAAYEAQKADLDDRVKLDLQQQQAEGMKEQRDAIAENRRAQAKHYETEEENRALAQEDRKDAQKAGIEAKEEDRVMKAFDAYTKGLPVIHRAVGQPGPDGWEQVPVQPAFLKKSNLVAFVPPPIAPVPPELQRFLPGQKMADRKSLEEALKQYRDDLVKKDALEAKPDLQKTADMRKQLADQYGLKGKDRDTFILTGQIHQPPPPGVTLNPEAQAFWAQWAATTGQLPSLGMGAAGAAARSQILNAAPGASAGGSVAENKSTFNADSDSLKKTTAMLDAVTAFENTAKANLDLFVSKAKPVIDSGSPLVNMPLRAVNVKALGGKDLAAYNAARQVALTEIAKVVNNPNLSSQLSDTARKEVMGLVPADATLSQVYSIVDVLRQDMSNRHKYLDQQVGAVRARIKTRGGSNSGNNSAGNQSDMIYMKLPDGRVGPIHKLQKQQFSADNPGAVEVQAPAGGK